MYLQVSIYSGQLPVLCVAVPGISTENKENASYISNKYIYGPPSSKGKKNLVSMVILYTAD